MPLRSFTLERVALLVFNRATKREREELLRAFESVCANPEDGFDSVVSDDAGRRLLALHHGRFAIFWWEDFADRRLRIVAIEELG